MSRVGRAPEPSDLSTALRMRLQRQKDTGCELAVRRLLHARGLRYRINCRPEPEIARRADIVFRPTKTAVFVDGCFWHQCPLHWKAPKRNVAWWTKKAETNSGRDAETTVLLESRGWLVIRAWEHEDPRTVADRILESVKRRAPERTKLRKVQR